MTVSRTRANGPVAGTTSVTVTYGATPATNALLLYFVFTKTGGTIGTPSGYTDTGLSASGGGFVGKIFQRRATGSESGGVACAVTSGTDSLGWIIEYSATTGLATLIAQVAASDASDAADGFRCDFAAQAAQASDFISYVNTWRDSTGAAAPTPGTRTLSIQSGGGTLGTKTDNAASTWGTGSLLRYNEGMCSYTVGGTPALRWQSNSTTTNIQGLSMYVLIRDVTSNTPPTANAGSDQIAYKAPAAVQLTAAASSDPDGSIASYAWTQLSGPTVTLNNPNTATPTFTPPSTTGTCVFQVTVTDNQGATATDTVSVVINDPGTGGGGSPVFVYNGTSWVQAQNVLTWNGTHWV